MFLSQTTVEQVRNYPDIVGIISDYVTLKRRGRNYIGLCPFHSERTPSFTVSAEKQFWHCFGCQESGDHISFVMKVDNLSFSEAVEHIAKKAGIEVTFDESRKGYAKEDGDLDQIRNLLFEAREVFRSFLSPSSEGYRYLSGRGLKDEVITEFFLGYSPQDFDLAAHLIKKGFSSQLLRRSGLFFDGRNEQLVSRFRRRVIFPVIDYRGRTVGFGGRILEASADTAKYVNSEENALFSKRKLWYGLAQARQAMGKTGSALVMEGYMDVITAHQYGFEHAIATMGTALTPDHAHKLSRFTKTVYLALDSDEAGQRAIEKSFEVLRPFDFTIFVIVMDGKDPADVLREKGAGYFQSLIDAALPMIEFQFQRLLKRYNRNRIEDVPKIVDDIIPFLRLEKDDIIRRQYAKRIASELSVETDIILEKIKNMGYTIINRRFIRRSDLSFRGSNKYLKAEEYIIYLLLADVGQRHTILDIISPDDLISPEARSLAQVLRHSDVVGKDLLGALKDPKQCQYVSYILMKGAINEGNESVSQTRDRYIAILKGQKSEQRITELRHQLKQAEDKGDDQLIAEVLVELQDLLKSRQEES